MRANYGYKDGSGEFFITIETDACVDCAQKPCVQACPAGVLEIIADDYDDRVAAVTEGARRKLKYVCAPCKPVRARPPLPCVEACPSETIEHSW
ncbi:MAG: ferredoxin [Planctomycetota bacterium]|jgi:Fe-S-cluster-containing hydrogenase component 2